MQENLNLRKIKELFYKEPDLFFSTEFEKVVVEKFLKLVTVLEDNQVTLEDYEEIKKRLEDTFMKNIIDTDILFELEEEAYKLTELDLILGDSEIETMEEVLSSLFDPNFLEHDIYETDLFFQNSAEGQTKNNSQDNSIKEELVPNFITLVLEGVIKSYNNQIDYKEAVEKLQELGYSFEALKNKEVDSVELVELVTLFDLEYDNLLE